MSETTTAEPPTWQPEFPGQRPPFAQGNLEALKSGAHSPRVFGPRASELASELLEVRPDLAAPGFAATVGVWAVFVARFELAAAAADPSDAWIVRLGNAAMKAGTALGLDPRSYAALMRDQAAAAVLVAGPELLAQRMAAGRAAIDARDAADARNRHDDDHEYHDDQREATA